MSKLAGKIKFFNDARGYGFITPDDGSPDVFLHSAVCEKHNLTPEQGMKVTFEAETSQKGRKATWIG